MDTKGQALLGNDWAMIVITSEVLNDQGAPKVQKCFFHNNNFIQQNKQILKIIKVFFVIEFLASFILIISI